MSRSNHRARIPVTLVTGFLGSGKTTLLNRLLSEPALDGTVAIINEFGAIGLDHLLVEVTEERFALLDNHVRTGDSLRTACRIIERHGGEVAAVGVFTAGDDVQFDRPLHVFLPHERIVEVFA